MFVCCFFFFKQKTAYEMRISDWSSDVCSSDLWGYNENAAKLGLGVVTLLYDPYFRVVARGVENIPARGPVLLIANHSGQLPLAGVLFGGATAINPDGPRPARAMAERFFPMVPWSGNLLPGNTGRPARWEGG